MKIELMIFDLARIATLDTQDIGRILQCTLTKFDTYVTHEEVMDVIDLPSQVAIKQLLDHYNDDLISVSREMIDAVHKTFVDDMIDFCSADPSVGEKEGVTETFRMLQQVGIKVAVNADFDRRITDTLLDRLGWSEKGLIDVTITRDEVPHDKPLPDRIHQLMNLVNVKDATRVAKVGGTIVDLLEGNAAGCGLVIGVMDDLLLQQSLLIDGPIHFVNTMLDVLPILSLHKEMVSVD